MNASDKGSRLRSYRADANLAASAATPTLPISMLLLPVVSFEPALKPNATLLLPVVLFMSALAPLAQPRR
jgi:hypothetical protein